jgi:hypothetical protein
MSILISPLGQAGARNKFFLAPALPHECGVPPGLGPPHLVGRDNLSLARRQILRLCPPAHARTLHSDPCVKKTLRVWA